MKNKIKLTALILSLLTLFGCAEKPLQSSGESSVTNSEVSSTDVASLVSEDEESADKKDEEKEYYTFSFSYDRYEVTNEYYLKNHTDEKGAYIEIDSCPLEANKRDLKFGGQMITGVKELLKLSDNGEKCIVVKATVSGDSYALNGRYCGDWQSSEFDDEFYYKGYDCVYTPVRIEAIVDANGTNSSIKAGDTYYLKEDYRVINENYSKAIQDYRNSLIIAEANHHWFQDVGIFEDFDSFPINHKKLLSYAEDNKDKAIVSERAFPLEQGRTYLLIIREKAGEISDDLKELLGDSKELAYYAYPFDVSIEPEIKSKAFECLNDIEFYKQLYNEAKDLYGSYFE
ncbi:MAG: hypothetical protein E7490_08420 [Ruminococcaceae bacterium]|nr:hypothetical protein [Oscillospiraceae bacterium]